MLRYYLLADTETGGLSPVDYDLLSCAFILMSRKFEELWAFDFRISLDTYRTTPEALNVNKLDLDECRRIGLRDCSAPKDISPDWNPEQAAAQANLHKMKQFLHILREDRAEVIVTCHNVPFDKPFLETWFKWLWGEPGKNNALVSYRSIDTIGCALMVADAGKLPTKNVKLETLGEHFNIPHDAHSALSDARVCGQVYKRLVELCKI